MTAFSDVETVGMTLDPGPDPVMSALSRHVPVTLLMDLADPAGPDSRRILATEIADMSWLRDLAFADTSLLAPAQASAVG